MTQEILVVSATEVLVQDLGNDSLVEQVTTQEVFEVAMQGPPGASWPEPFALAARFGEIAADPTAKAQARANLDLQDIDCGTFN